MFYRNIFACVFVLVKFSVGLRIDFTSCQSVGWTCLRNEPSDIVYTCAAAVDVSTTR